MNASEYLSGQNKAPIKVSLRPSDNPEATSAPSSNGSSSNIAAPVTTSSSSAVSSTSSSPAPSSSSSTLGRSGSVSQPRNIFDTKQKEEVVEYYTPKEVKVVRSSKFRHIAGKSAMKVHQYENMRVLSEA